MYRKIEFIALVPNTRENSNNNYTMYFLEKSEKYLLPIDVSRYEARKYLTGTNHKSIPSVYSTFSNVLCNLEANIRELRIYAFDNGNYKMCLDLEKGSHLVEFGTNFVDGLILAKLNNIPLSIHVAVLHTWAIKITKRLLRDALYYSDEDTQHTFKV